MNNYDLIGMAWADKISFEEIKKRTGFSEKEVIAVMRRKLKKDNLYYTNNLINRIVRLPLHNYLTFKEIDYICLKIKQYFKKQSKDVNDKYLKNYN